MLTPTQVDSFVEHGFVRIPHVVPKDVVRACVDEIWAILDDEGVRRDTPASWRSPVVRIACPETPAFAAAGTTPELWEAYDQLLGEGRWWKRQGLGGSIPIRFPHPDDPGDAGWHVEASYAVDGVWRTNVFSRGRGLLVIFLLTDVGESDAPTRIRVGSHLDVPRVLAPAGKEGFDGATLSPLVERASRDRDVVHATGTAGDVYVCHPFLVHAASWPHSGTVPRIIAQPGVATLNPFGLGGDPASSPVEASIIRGLGVS